MMKAFQNVGRSPADPCGVVHAAFIEDDIETVLGSAEADAQSVRLLHEPR